MVWKRLLRRQRPPMPTSDWFQPASRVDGANDDDGGFEPLTPPAPGDSFVGTLLEGDPALEATMRGVRNLRADARESIRRRFITLEDLRRASIQQLVQLDGIGETSAIQVLTAAQPCTELLKRVKGLRADAIRSLGEQFPSVGALASADPDTLTGAPGVGPATVERILAAVRG
jgi:ERCC4-type nuclease